MESFSSPIVLDPVGRDVHEEGMRLRAKGPIAEVVLPGGVRAWSVTGYQMVRQVLADKRFAKDPKNWSAFVDGEISDDFPLIGWVLMDNMTTSDGEDHTRLRKILSRAFTMRRVDAMKPEIEQIVARLLDEMAASAPGEAVDLKSRYAYPLTTQVICGMFGVPEENRVDVLRGGEVNVQTTISHEDAVANVEQWHQAIFDVIAAKKAQPGDDLLSELIAIQREEGESRISDSELAGTLHLLLGAGSETSTNLICQAALALLTHPEQLLSLRNGIVTWRDVTEETLRVQSPINQLPFRFTTEEVQIGGVTIPRGDPVLICFAAAGRDNERFGDNADKFELSRADKEHLSFGYGVHHCLGAPLARLEGAIAIPALFDRFPQMALAVPPDDIPPQGSFVMNGHAQVPVLLGR
jgi:2-hydroxy-5-methyl-1-naphthoate 7-hydroxylase